MPNSSQLSRTSLIFREISNYFFLQKAIRKAAKTKQWQDLKLRYTLSGRIYTVRSVSQEDMGEEESVRRYKAVQMTLPIHDYIASIGLQEIVFPSIENVADANGNETRSFLLVYTPLFKELTITWIVWRILFAAGLITAALNVSSIISLFK